MPPLYATAARQNRHSLWPTTRVFTTMGVVRRTLVPAALTNSAASRRMVARGITVLFALLPANTRTVILPVTARQISCDAGSPARTERQLAQRAVVDADADG